MSQKVGVVQNITGKFQAVDKDGNVRILQQGDFIYEGEAVSAVHQGEGDSATQNENGSTENFITIKDLRNGEIYLIPENGYRYFSIQEMGKDEAALARLGISSGEQTDNYGEDTGSGFLRGGAFAGPQEFLGDPVSPGIPEDLSIENSMEEIPDPEPDPDSDHDPGTEPDPNHPPVITGDSTGSVTEVVDKHPDENNITHETAGTLTFGDADPGDSHTVTATPKGGGYLGNFTHTVDPVTGEIDWKFAVDDADLDHLKEGETITQTYTFTVDDGHGGITTKDVTVTIVGRNDGPVAIDDGKATFLNTPVSDNVLDNDHDVDSDTLTVTEFTIEGMLGTFDADGSPVTITDGGTTVGTIELNADGSYTFTPAENWQGDVPVIHYNISDGQGGTDTADLVITVSNDNPLLAPDFNQVTEDDPDQAGHDDTNLATSIVAGNVLDNDSDEHGDPLTVVGVAKGDTNTNLEDNTTVATGILGDYGTVTINADGTYEYALDNTNSAVQALSTGDILTEVFTYTASDGQGGVKNTTLTITIDGVNDAPVVVPDTNNVTEDTVLSAGGNVLDNDSDAENQPLTVVGVAAGTQPDNLTDPTTVGNTVTGTYGTVTINANGTYSYDLTNDDPRVQALAQGETLTDTFTYTASDGNGGIKHTTLTITINGVNDAPEIQILDGDANTGAVTEADDGLVVSDTLSLYDIDTTDTVSIAKVPNQTVGVGGTYTDPLPAGLDNDALLDMFSITGSENSGTEQLAQNGATWTFNSGTETFDFLAAGETLTLSYTVQATDDSGAANNTSAEETITITITGTNDAPTVEDVAIAIDKDETASDALKITLTANDPDSDASHFKLTSLPPAEYGTLYTDAAMTTAVAIDTDIAVTGTNELTLYFKPNYSTDGSTPFGPDYYTASAGTGVEMTPNGEIAVLFNFQAKDTDPDALGNDVYSNEGTAKITIDDVPIAVGETKEVVENAEGQSSVQLTGNLLTDGPDFAGGKDYQGKDGATVSQVRYTDDSDNEVTADVADGGSTFDTKYGSLTVNPDGSYTYTPDGGIDHSAGGDDPVTTPDAHGDDIRETFSYTIKDGDGDVSDWAEQNIDIHDGALPDITDIDDGTIREANLPTGSDPDPDQTTITDGFTVTPGTDLFDVTFDSTTALEALGLTSGSTDLTYSISPDGHTLTAVKDGTTDEVFTVTITGYNTASPQYEFTLHAPLDHAAGDTEIELPFTVKVNDDDDGDNDTEDFTVTVVDDAPENPKNIALDEDTDLDFTTNADADPNNTYIEGNSGGGTGWVDTPHGRARVNDDGTITYEPDDDYSGTDSFTYTTTGGNGDTQIITVNVTVNPIADAPIMGGNVGVETPEDTPVALNTDLEGDWKLPEIKDDTDQTPGADADWPERLGLLELSGLPAGATVRDVSGNILFTADGSNGTMQIRITDKTDYHTTEAMNDTTPGIVELTEAAFNALQVQAPEHSSTDMNLELSATEYEVNATGNIIGAAGSETSTQPIAVKVTPVTDDFTLTPENVTFNGDEDHSIKINDAFTFNVGPDQDGSERYSLSFSSTEDLSHVLFRVGDSGPWKTLTEFNGTHFDGNASMPDIYVRTIANDSRDIKGLTLTVTAQDHDEDDDTEVGAVISKSITLDDIPIVPLANDVTLQPGGAEGDEDTLIDMGLTFTNNDGHPDHTGSTYQEVVDHLIISGIPEGVTIYSGTRVVFTGDGSTEFNTSTPGDGGAALTQTEIENLQLLPPQDFSGEIELGVKVYSQDTDDDPADPTQVTTEGTVTAVTHTITVKGVVDTSYNTGTQTEEGAEEINDTGRLYVTIKDVLTTDHTAGGFTAPEFQGEEDEACAITGLSWKSYEGVDHSVAPHNNPEPETATFIIKNYDGDTTDFTLEDAAGNAIGTQVAGGWQVTEADLANIHVKAPDDFGGTIHLALETTVKDGEDENVQTDPFDVVFTPVTEDSLTMNLTDVYATEDIPAKFDIYPETTDLDGSEKVTQVELSDIPDGVTFYIQTGPDTYTQVGYDDSNSLTITVDEDNPDPANGVLTTEQLKNLYIQAPPESNNDFDVTVKPTVKEPGDTGPGVTGEQEVHIYVQGDADVPVPVNDPLPNLIGAEPQAEGENLVDISGLVHESGETESGQAAADDHSETLTYVLHDLPPNFVPTDADGNIIGDFVSTENGNVTWSFTQEQMEQLHIQVPENYSGTTNLNLEVISVENDGDTNSTGINTIPLKITPVVTTEDPVVHEYTALEPVTLHDGNSGPGATSEDDTFVPLTFTNTVDGETVTKVVIGTVPTGVEVGTLVGDTFTAATSGIITDNFDHIVARIIGTGVLNDKTDDIILGNITVTVADPSDDGTVAPANKELDVGDITIHVEGQADQPYIVVDNVEDPAATGAHYNNIELSTTFPDDDGSEDHYYTVKAPDDTVLLNKGTYQGDGIWYLTKTEMNDVQTHGGLHAWFNGASTEEKQLTITAYARENDVQQNSVTVTIKGDPGGPPQPTIEAQTPILQVEDPQPNEDNSFSLADVVVGTGTGNQDTDGDETLSFVIKNLDMTNIESIEGVSEYTDDAGNIFYRFDVPGVEPGPDAIEAALANVIITPAEDYSGPITFTLEAIAYEPAAPAGKRFASTSEEVTINVQPVAEDALVVTTPAPVDEDSITPVTLALSNKDASNPESFDNVSLELTEPDSGQFVDDSGNPLGTSLTGLSYDPGTDTFTTSGGDQVYYQPPENKDGTFPITVTADMHDGDSTTSGATATVNIEVIPIPDSGTFVIKDSSGNEVNTTDNKLEVGEDGLVQLKIEADSFDDGDGSEFQTVLIKDVPPGMLFYDAGGNPVGELIEQGTLSTWKLPTSVMGGNLYIQPPLHCNDDITLTVVGVAMEAGAMGSQYDHEAQFTLDIAPEADGVQIFPETAQGEEDLPIAINLRAKLVADEEIATAGLPHDSNETYNVKFYAGSGDITLFWKDDAGEYHTLANEDSDSDYFYTVTGLSQEQIDSLHLQIEGNRAGSFTVGVDVSSSDGDTTSASQTATLGIVASYEYDSQTAADPDQTIIIDDTTHIFAQSGNDEITGDDATYEVIDGGKGRDTLDGGTGADELYGGKGDDTLVFDANDTVIDGGDGDDTLQVGASNVDFTSLASDLIVDMEVIDLSDPGSQDITLALSSVQNMTDDGNTLMINGDSGDTVNLVNGGWNDTGTTETIDGITYHIFNDGGATTQLKIQDGVDYNIA